jgi:hypothetical protein
MRVVFFIGVLVACVSAQVFPYSCPIGRLGFAAWGAPTPAEGKALYYDILREKQLVLKGILFDENNRYRAYLAWEGLKYEIR